MTRTVPSLAGALLATLLAGAAPAPVDAVYELGPDSQAHPNVPHGTIYGPTTLPSNVYPNTTRNYWVYVPAQYDPARPASLMVFFDGHYYLNLKGQYRVPYVFDNLIHRREMPVTIAVFVNPGHGPNQKEPTDSDWGDGTSNRPREYNELDDLTSKLVIDELLPQVTAKWNISPRPEDRGLCGASSGAICAWTIAWHRPDQFGKVVSMIGSFTNIRGGDAYPDMIRAAPAKPIRIFLQDGINDHRVRGKDNQYDARRDWHLQNTRMVAALTEKHYDVNYCWGTGTHSNAQGGAQLPEMLRWLWRDYPRADDPLDEKDRGLLGATTKP